MADPSPRATTKPSTPVVKSAETPEDAQAGFGGVVGFDPGEAPAELSGKDLFLAAKEKAPNLTPEFVSAYRLSDDNLRDIAAGAVPPPPVIGPVHTSDLYFTPGGWVQTKPGMSLEEHAAEQAARR
jgi:hypothetical protein